MLSFASPWWLPALLAVPLVWWLHRFHERGRLIPVAALFLWSADSEAEAGVNAAARAQPVWLLRGALVCLLALALGDPRWTSGESQPLIVWIDDSSSMFATDGQDTTRLQRALEELARRVSSATYTSITFRSLSVPGRSLALDADASTPWTLQLGNWASGGEPQPPPPVFMTPGAEHWLLSDGASPVLTDWVARAPLSSMVSVGGASDNVGISGLVFRRSRAAPQAGQLLVSVSNGGTKPARRTLEAYAGSELLARRTLLLPPGAQVPHILSLQTLPRAGIRALISPADNLPLDDHMEIPAGALRLPVVKLSGQLSGQRSGQRSGQCSQYLRAALSAHPAAISDDGPPDLWVSCGAGATAPQGPGLRLASGASVKPGRGDPLWHPAAGSLQRLSLAAQSLRVVGPDLHEPELYESVVPILTAGAQTLISQDPQRQLVDVRLDLADEDLVRHPEYPLLVSGLVDLALGRDSSTATATREAIRASIAPRDLLPGPVSERGRVTARQRGLSSQLIACALLLLCLDLLLGAWRALRQSRQFKNWRAGFES